MSVAEQIKNCKDCGTSSSGQEFKGVRGDFISHYKSQDGWWVSVRHVRNIFSDPPNKVNRVDNILCPKCLKDYEERMSVFLDELGINGDDNE